MVQFYERRNDARKLHKAPVLVQELDDVYIYNARMVNFNFKGIYFESDVELEVGKQIIIGIEDSIYISPYASIDSPNFYHAIIMWRKDLTGGTFNFGYGAKFVYFSDHQNVPKTDSTLKVEYRKHPRKLYTQKVIISSAQKYYAGSIGNISRGGAFIKTQINFKKGQKILLVLPKSKKYRRTVIKGVVLHLTQDGIGVVFKRITKRLSKSKN